MANMAVTNYVVSDKSEILLTLRRKILKKRRSHSLQIILLLLD